MPLADTELRGEENDSGLNFRTYRDILPASLSRVLKYIYMEKRVSLEITEIFFGLINIIHSLYFSLELPPLIVS